MEGFWIKKEATFLHPSSSINLFLKLRLLAP